MTVLRIPTPLRSYTSGKSEVSVNGSNVSEALMDLTTQYPPIKPHLFNEGGELRPFVNLFIGENNIKDLQGVNTPIQDGDKLVLIPSIAGGSCHCEEGLARRLRPGWSAVSPRWAHGPNGVPESNLKASAES